MVEEKRFAITVEFPLVWARSQGDVEEGLRAELEILRREGYSGHITQVRELGPNELRS